MTKTGDMGASLVILLIWMTISGNMVRRMIAELKIKTAHQGSPINEFAFIITYLTLVMSGSRGLKNMGI
jgi:hypothetical protein